MHEDITKLNDQAKLYSDVLARLASEMKKVIVGQDDVIEKLILALVSRGHVLLEGVPGLAKTLMVRTLAECMDCRFVRLQFTPDLLPADITGTKIYDHENRKFTTLKGPIFSNFILADEINRAPPKVQSALLEAMQERQVSIQGETYSLEKPFLVMATQNPIESEGTYMLPEAQIDRFMFKLLITYPDKAGEIEIIDRFTEGDEITVSKVLSVEEILAIQAFCPQIYADRSIKTYVAEIVDATRHPENYKLDIAEQIEYGASPRASLWLILGAKAHALAQGRGYVLPEDVQAIAFEVLRHRLLLTYEAEAEEISSDELIQKILGKIKVP